MKKANILSHEEIVISIDPGREKCGLAVVKRPNIIIHKGIVPTKNLVAAVQGLAAQHGAARVILGNGTSSSEHSKRLHELVLQNKVQDIVSVDEYRTTDMARIRYWQENPPQGWRRFVPVTMQVAPVPVDDYVAVILAERYFKALS
ncbi:MAG: pre-16S rRNA-processing nuclease YqgF [Pelosinus sp.]|nr:pre-16S rRNA-processing nuclease YqgF [Pelosinus sp.]